MIFHKPRVKNKGVIRESGPSGKRYLAFPETSDGRKYFHSFTRRRDGGGSCQIIEEVRILLINCIIKDKNAKYRGIRNFGGKLNFAF